MEPDLYTILVIDDSVTQIAILQDALEKEGYQVETAQDGMEAIAKVYHSPPSLILSDVMMPELNGYHLCRLLKNDPCTAHIPVILLTNLKERHDRFWGENAGADRYIEKGSNLAPILAEVSALLSLEAVPRPGAIAAHTELSSEDIRLRVTAILDRLLYESTISNEVLKLTGLAHDVDQLAREFLGFLSVICRYSAASLLLCDGRDKYVLCIQTIEPMSAEAIEMIRKQTLTTAGLAQESQVSIRLLRLGEQSDAQDGQGDLNILQTLPVADEGEQLATLALFSKNKERVTDGTRHALNVVAERFLIVARYLKKFKEIEEVKADFISMLVHDMRAPLTSIRGFTDVLAEGILGAVNEEQASALQNIQGGCDRLLTLIEDVLDLSKLEAGKMQIYKGPLSVRPLAARVCADLSALSAEKGLEVRLDIPEDLPWVLADGKQLTRVLANLLTNAFKFTPTGGAVIVSAQSPATGQTQSPGSFLQISVTDTGPGIPPQQQLKLFTRYQQLHGTRTFAKGTGLGLAICKEIILLHDGEIWVESPIGPYGGSRFTFTLPTDTDE